MKRIHSGEWLNEYQAFWTTGLAIAMIGTSSAFAKDIFTAEVQVDGVTQMIGYNKILNVADQYESENMRKIFPNYSDTSAVSANWICAVCLSTSVMPRTHLPWYLRFRH